MKKVLVFESGRAAYDIAHVKDPVTVRELREMLEMLDDNLPIIFSHDVGYTFGSINRTATIMEAHEGEYEPEYKVAYDLQIWKS